LEKMEEIGRPLLVHGESTDPMIDVFDREKAFIEESLGPLLERFSQLKVVLEHITTRDAVQYVEVTGANVAATITAHHLLMNRNALFMGGIRPHHYCLPVLKREEHREALVEAATSGNPKFFLGSDSAPHARGAKEAGCGCAGGARWLRSTPPPQLSAPKAATRSASFRPPALALPMSCECSRPAASRRAPTTCTTGSTRSAGSPFPVPRRGSMRCTRRRFPASKGAAADCAIASRASTKAAR